MTRARSCLAAAILAFATAALVPSAVETAGNAFSVDDVMSYPFPENLVASPTGSAIAWTFNERGIRNIYVAEGPQFAARRLTQTAVEDGQELTSLAFSTDGKTIVYVRGGDHGANNDPGYAPNPTSSTTQPKVQVWAVPVAGGPARLLGDGDRPAISPKNDRVAFENKTDIWIAPLDGSKPAASAFATPGSNEAPAWSPDGSLLAFVSNRGDHSLIGLYSEPSEPIRYIAPTTSRDSSPVWSPDGRRIAFVRQPGRGGTPPPPLVQQPLPWSLWVAEVERRQPDGSTITPAHEVWKSGTKLVDSVPRTTGGVNLHWGAGDRLVYLSYQDGWPHLYSIETTGPTRAPMLLTAGAFMVEHVTMTPDRRGLVYSANTGSNPNDIDRRHIFKVPLDRATPSAVTSGAGVEWTPVVTGDGQTIAFLGAGGQISPLPAIVPMSGGTARRIAGDRVPAAFPADRLVTPEAVTFRSSDGLEIHGQIFKTAGATARRPAVIYVHGGPPRQMLLGWHYMGYYANDYAANQYLASQGFIVLSVNYRLGIGYGQAFHYPDRAGARGASEYLDVLAAGKYLQARTDVDPKRVGLWGGSYGGYLVALGLGKNSDVFAAGVDIHGVHDRTPPINPDQLAHAIAGDGMTEAEYRQALKIAYQSSPISTVATWKSPVLLIHGDDDRNVQFRQTVDLKQRLLERGVQVEELVIPDDIHDFLLWRSWKTVATATAEYLERRLRVHGP